MVRGTRQHAARESIWRQVRKAENKGTQEEDVVRSSEEVIKGDMEG